MYIQMEVYGKGTRCILNSGKRNVIEVLEKVFVLIPVSFMLYTLS